MCFAAYVYVIFLPSQMEMEEKIAEEFQEDVAPLFILKPKAVETFEGEPAKFLVKVAGYPRPHVTWWINSSLIVSVS